MGVVIYIFLMLGLVFIKKGGWFLKYLDLLSWGGRRKKMIKIKKSVREKSPDLNLD